MRPGKWKPDTGGRRASDAVSGLRALYGKGEVSGSSARAPRVPANWRNRMPDPATYYAAHIKPGKRSGAWTMALCPFHDDHNPSFGVKLGSEGGHWECFAGCGRGDMVAFHMRLRGVTFVEAVRELAGVRT